MSSFGLPIRLAESCLGLVHLASKDQSPNLVEMAVGVWVCVVVRPTTPESALVDLQPLVFRSTEYHCTHATVAKRQGFGPFRGGFVESKLKGGVGCPRAGTEGGCRCHHDQSCSDPGMPIPLAARQRRSVLARCHCSTEMTVTDLGPPRFPSLFPDDRQVPRLQPKSLCAADSRAGQEI